MSNYAQVLCLTCNDNSGRLDRFNHGTERLAAILNHRELLEKFGELVRVLEKAGVCWNPREELFEIMHYLVHHKGHDIRAGDEYGEVYGLCAQDVKCACGSRRYCRKPIGHPPPCVVPHV